MHGGHYLKSDGDQNYVQAYKTVEYNLHIFSFCIFSDATNWDSKVGKGMVIYMEPMESLF